VRGWYEDDWVSGALEFAVVPEIDVARMRVEVTLPPGLPEGTQLCVDVDGARVGAAAAGAIDCAVRLKGGEPAAIRIATTATVNLKECGVSEDARDLGFHLDAVIFEA
jgi:hypothetical protein